MGEFKSYQAIGAILLYQNNQWMKAECDLTHEINHFTKCRVWRDDPPLGSQERFGTGFIRLSAIDTKL
jgi:hypothetical protein